jgi:hypothetical protein
MIMKTKKNLVEQVLMSILTVTAMFVFTACSNYMDYEEEDQQKAINIVDKTQRTVLVYVAGRNDLSLFAGYDLQELKEGSKQLAKDQALLVFMRRCHDNEEPWLARIENGKIVNKVTIGNMGIDKDQLYASDPEVMEQVISYAFSHYPSVSNDYGLVLWGHGSGWLIEKEVNQKSTSRGYGVDVGNYIYSTDGRWINIPTLNNVLSRLPHLKFIFADCCNFMCLESLYELRNVTDYIIGSPAEIPGMGAPYQTVVPAMFEPETFYHSIAERYYKATEGELPLSVVKTSEMEQVAQATRNVLKSLSDRESGYPDMTGMIHYNYLGSRYEPFNQMYNIFYDAGNFIRCYATTEEYQEWKQALDKAVIEKYIAYSWDVIKGWQKFYTDFEVTEENYHGVSMYVPQDGAVEHGEYYQQLNKDIAQMQWLYAVNE